VKTARSIRKRNGWGADANADNHVAFLTGLLAGLTPIDLVIIGTGDGQLAEDVAEAVSQLPKPLEVVTLSLAGSTATRLDARVCPLIAANIEVGLDCLRPRDNTANTSSSVRPKTGAKTKRSRIPARVTAGLPVLDPVDIAVTSQKSSM
jgi:hypothetical protein